MLLVIGTVGNVCVLRLLSYLSWYSKTHMFALALLNLGVVYTALLDLLVYAYTGHFLLQHTQQSCWLTLTIISSMLSSGRWLMASLFLARLLVILQPYRVELFANRKLAPIVVTSLLILTASATCFTRLVDGMTSHDRCGLTPAPRTWVTALHLSLAYLLPHLVMLTSSLLVYRYYTPPTLTLGGTTYREEDLDTHQLETLESDAEISPEEIILQHIRKKLKRQYSFLTHNLNQSHNVSGDCQREICLTRRTARSRWHIAVCLILPEIRYKHRELNPMSNIRSRHVSDTKRQCYRSYPLRKARQCQNIFTRTGSTGLADEDTQAFTYADNHSQSRKLRYKECEGNKYLKHDSLSTSSLLDFGNSNRNSNKNSNDDSKKENQEGTSSGSKFHHGARAVKAAVHWKRGSKHKESSPKSRSDADDIKIQVINNDETDLDIAHSQTYIPRKRTPVFIEENSVWSDAIHVATHDYTMARLEAEIYDLDKCLESLTSLNKSPQRRRRVTKSPSCLSTKSSSETCAQVSRHSSGLSVGTPPQAHSERRVQFDSFDSRILDNILDSDNSLAYLPEDEDEMKRIHDIYMKLQKMNITRLSKSLYCGGYVGDLRCDRSYMLLVEELEEPIETEGSERNIASVRSRRSGFSMRAKDFFNSVVFYNFITWFLYLSLDTPWVVTVVVSCVTSSTDQWPGLVQLVSLVSYCQSVFGILIYMTYMPCLMSGMSSMVRGAVCCTRDQGGAQDDPQGGPNGPRSTTAGGLLSTVNVT